MTAVGAEGGERIAVPAIEGIAVDWEHRRELFAHDPAVAHLNHGSFGAVSHPVRRAQLRLRDELDANPMAFFTRGLQDRLGHTRRHLATFVGADPDAVALIPNATAAATAVLRSLTLSAGWEILVTDHGYGAVRLAAQDVAARAGASVREVTVPLDADDETVEARILSAIRPGRTRVAIIDHIASPTAKLFPVQRLVARLRDRDVLTIVDAAHAPGQLAESVISIDADFWFGNLHKWAFAPLPTALLAVAPNHRPMMRPLVVSWEQERGFPLAQEFAGTLDYTAWLAAPAGVHLLRTLGADRVRAYNSDLAAQGQRLVAAAVAAHWHAGSGGSSPYGSANRRIDDNPIESALSGRLGSHSIAMRLIPLPLGVADTPDSATSLRTRLATEFAVEVAVGVWRQRGWLRVSAQVYNRIEDYERLSHALATVLSRSGS